MAYTPQTATNSNGDFSGSIVYSAIRPKDPSQNVATVYSNDIRGTVHHYATIAERNAIIEQRREWGMLCTVYNDGTPSNNGTYILNYGGSTASITDNIYWGIYSPGSQVVLGPNSGLTYSGGSYSTTNSSLAGVGLTKSSNTLSVLLDGLNPGLTVSSNGLKIIDLIMTTSSVTLDTNILGKYTTDPTTLPGWDYLSIPTKSYVDAIGSGLTLKQAVRVAATGSITILSAPSQIDGVTVDFGDRILLWKQDDTVNGTSSNGIYIYNGVGASMSRSTDMDGNPSSEVSTGVYTFVTEGTTYQGSGFVIVASGTVSGQIQVGTQSMKWTQFSSAGNYIWNNGIIATGNVVDIDLFTNGGLTFSSGQLKIDLLNNSGLSINNGLYIDTTFAGTGLTMNNGVMSVNNPILASSGLTNSGLTFSVNLKSNSGLTFSNGLLDLSIGTGLTVSSGFIALSPLLFNGLTYSGGSYSVNIATNAGLTFDAFNSLSIDTTLFGKGLVVDTQKVIVDAGYGLTFSNNTLVSNINNNGLTFSNGQTSLNIGNGLTFSGGTLISNVGSGLTFSNGQLAISGSIGMSGPQNYLTIYNSPSGITASTVWQKAFGSFSQIQIGGDGSDINSDLSKLWVNINNTALHATSDPGLVKGMAISNLTTATGSTLEVGLEMISYWNSGSQSRTAGMNMESLINDGSSLAFYTMDSQSSRQNRMFIGPNGYVGLGNYTYNNQPKRNLVINGNTTTDQGTKLAFYNSGPSQSYFYDIISFRTDTYGGTGATAFYEYSGVAGYMSNRSATNSNGTINLFAKGTTGGRASNGLTSILSANNSMVIIGGFTTSTGYPNESEWDINNYSGLRFTTINSNTSLTSSNVALSVDSNGNVIVTSKSVNTVGNGLTASGNTFSVNINTNGLTFSSNQLVLNIGTGLTFSGGLLTTSIGVGLTFSSGSISLNGPSVVGSGLTWSNNQISLPISLTGTQSQMAFWGTTTSVLSTSNLTWNNTSGVLSYSTGSASSIYPLVLENTTTGGGVSNGSVGFRLLSGSGTASFYYAKSSGVNKNDNALNISIPNSGMTINANGQNGDGHNFEVYASGYGQGTGNFYHFVNQNLGNPRGQLVLADSNGGSGQSEFVISQIGLLTKLKGYTTGGALSYGTASQTNNIITFTNQNIYLGSYSTLPTGILSAPTSSVIVEIAPGSSNLIPLKLNSGPLASTTQNGGIEFNGTHSYITIGGNRFQMDNYLIGAGLSVSGLTLSTSLSSGDGLTANGNTFSVNINTNGLTFSGNQLGLNIGSGLTFSGGQLNSSVNVSGTTNTIPVFTSGGFTNSMSYQINANFGHTASNGNSFPIPGAIVVGGKYFGISDILLSVAVRDNSLTANGTSVYPQLGVSVGLTYSGSTGTSSAGVAAISTQVIDGVDNRRSALFTNYTDSLWGISNTGTNGGMSFGIWQSTNRVMTIGSNLNVNFQPGSTHSDSGYFFTVGGSSYFKGKITTTASGSGLQFLGLTSGSATSTGQYIGVDSLGDVINLTGPISGNGLTNSGSTFSLSIGNGLTFSSSKLNLLVDSTPSGLTLSSTGIKVRYNQTSGLNIYSSGGATDNQLYIDWTNIIGSGLTWSGATLNTSSAVITKYAVGPLIFTASVTQTITHSIGNLEYIIQMYSNSTGEEILSQYSNRTSNTIDITVFEDTSDVKIVVIG